MSSVYVKERSEAERQMGVIVQAISDLSDKTNVLTKTIAEEGNTIGEGLAGVNRVLAPAATLMKEAGELGDTAKKSLTKTLEFLDAQNNAMKNCSLD